MWYAAKTGTHQGLVVEEKTGANIAVVYDKVNTGPIAAALDMMEALEGAESELERVEASTGQPIDEGVIMAIRNALAKAKENCE